MEGKETDTESNRKVSRKSYKPYQLWNQHYTVENGCCFCVKIQKINVMYLLQIREETLVCCFKPLLHLRCSWVVRRTITVCYFICSIILCVRNY